MKDHLALKRSPPGAERGKASSGPEIPNDELRIINPLEFPEWDSLLAKQPESSFFHSGAWARVLHETYRHTPLYFCWMQEGKLKAMLPMMEVSSRWTGRRGVSLPFTDFCAPLKTDRASAGELYEAAKQHGGDRGWRYLECRSSGRDWTGASPSLAFYSHVVDLRSGQQALFNSFESAVRRGIRKAEGGKLHVEFSDSPDTMRMFYSLHCKTRRRHGLPPQPFRFFDNIRRYILDQNDGFIVTAKLGQRPVAAAVFFHFGREAIYKFGASDYAAQNLRPNNLVMWAAIQRYAKLGFERLHLGRTSINNDNLRRFKLGFGAQEEEIAYCKYDLTKARFVTDVDRAKSWVNNVFPCLPGPLLRLAGRVLYPHLS